VAAKFTNCGQVCLAPDYVFVHQEISTILINELKKEIEAQFTKDPKTCDRYSRLIHEVRSRLTQAHCKRTDSLIKGHEDKIIAKFGEVDIANRFYPPTIVLQPDLKSTLMQEEIFGPIWPIFAYQSPEEVIKVINSISRPLSVYYYGNPDSVFRQRLEESTVSGSFVVNDSVMQFAVSTLPFGGIGDSGYGRTHGETGKNTANLRLQADEQPEVGVRAT
jgi:acyl-CoA reductase-like NAD-dependent aldehyde dehydrogenase